LTIAAGHLWTAGDVASCGVRSIAGGTRKPHAKSILLQVRLLPQPLIEDAFDK